VDDIALSACYTTSIWGQHKQGLCSLDPAEDPPGQYVSPHNAPERLLEGVDYGHSGGVLSNTQQNLSFWKKHN
jgi:hypothetical protein